MDLQSWLLLIISVIGLLLLIAVSLGVWYQIVYEHRQLMIWHKMNEIHKDFDQKLDRIVIEFNGKSEQLTQLLVSIADKAGFARGVESTKREQSKKEG